MMGWRKVVDVSSFLCVVGNYQVLVIVNKGF